MKIAVFILHQKTSEAGSIAIKLKKRGFKFEIVRPSLGEELPTDLNKYNAIVIFGGPMSVNDKDEYMQISAVRVRGDRASRRIAYG